ncbi:hypothetical protein CRUP_020521 [Coryphaenoides rupestris]|nr:hypothetical protein CRUP_020521 [Coryphaenoides rupestris]
MEMELRVPPCDAAGAELCVVDMHTGGEPLRVVLSGYPQTIPGDTLLAKRRHVREHLDHLRTALMFEPRGHRDMYGALLLPPVPVPVPVVGGEVPVVGSEVPVADADEADVAVLFMHNEGYSTMCGHAVIALGRLAVDYRLVRGPPRSPETRVNIQCPCGLVTAFVEYADGKTRGVRFHSVPAFAFATDVSVTVEGFGEVVVDISYGGAFYAFASAQRFGLDVSRSRTRDLVDVATAVTNAVRSQVKLHHPTSEDLAFLYGTILTDGVTARIALQHHKGLIGLNQSRTFKSGATGSEFTGKAVQETTCGDFPAVVVEVAGRAFYTGVSRFVRRRKTS